MIRGRTAFVVVALLLLNACTADTGTFDAEGDASVPCLRHQTNVPGPAYTSGGEADTSQILRMLRYYTVNGHKPYCDGKPPTKTDRRWATRYVELGADRANVAPILG